MGLESKKIGFLSGSILSILLILFIFYFLTPHYIKENISKLVTESGEVNLEISDASVRGLWLRFQKLSICCDDCSERDPLVLKADTVRISPDFRHFWDRSKPMLSVEMNGLNVKLDFSSPSSVEKIKKVMMAAENAIEERLPNLKQRNDKVKKGEEMINPDIDNKSFLGKVPIVSNLAAVTVLLPDGLTLKADGLSILPSKKGNCSNVSFGKLTFRGKNIEGVVNDVEIKNLCQDNTGSLRIGKIVLLNPEIKMDVSGSSIINSFQKVKAKENSKGKSIERIFELAHKFLSQFKHYIKDCYIESAAGSISILSKGSNIPLLHISDANSTCKFDLVGETVELSSAGKIEDLPYSVKAKMDENAINFEADLPHIRLGNFSGLKLWKDTLDVNDVTLSIEGDLNIRKIPGEIIFNGRLEADEFEVNYPPVAAKPLSNLHVSFDGGIRFSHEPVEFVIEDSDIFFNQTPFKIEVFSIRKEGEKQIFKFKGKIPPSQCQNVFESLPLAVRDNLAGFKFSGVLQFDFYFDIDFSHPRSSIIDFHLDNQCEVIEKGDKNLEKFNHTFVHEVEDKTGKHEFIMGPGSDNWCDYENIPQHLIDAILASEDGTFYQHKGVSPFAIKRAVKLDLEEKGFYHGASTITMQLCKNLFLSREKTIARKLQEIIFSWWLEKSMDKDSIMELYLNVIEFGPEIYGIKSASKHYFNKDPGDLNFMESIFLAKMLPNPVARYRYFEDVKATGTLAPEWRRVLERTAEKMLKRGIISKEEYEEGIKQELNFAIDSNL